MAGTQLDYIIQQFSITLQGGVHAGDGESCSLPKIEKMMEKFQGGGMLFPRQRGLGYKEMIFESEFSSFDPKILALGGLYVGNQDLTFSVAGFMDGDANAQHTVNCQMTGEVMSLDPGKWESGKKAKLSFKAALSAVTLNIDNALAFQLDAQNAVYNFGGTDIYAAVKAALNL